MPDRRRTAVTVAVALLLSGCAGIPQGGGVHIGRPVPAPGGLGDIDVRVLPAAAQRGDTPSDIVRGFLRALVNSDGDYEIARSYLTRRASSGWDAGSRVTAYDDSGVAVAATSRGSTSRTLEFHAPRVGAIDERGNFEPRAGVVRASFGVVRQNGQWRIDRLADGVLLSTLDALRAFKAALVYYLNPAGTTLVPEQVLLRPTQRGAPTALVRALLAGPGPWLAPSVHTGFPAGTELLGNVPVDPTGIAEVNLSSSVRQASPTQLRALSAQVVWTLRQVGETITAVRLLADGSPLVVHGQPANQPVSAWREFNPSAPPDPVVAAYDNRGSWRSVGGTLTGLTSAVRLTGLALSHDTKLIAGLRKHAHSVSLLVGARGARLDVRLTADTLTPPTFSRSGLAVTVQTRGGVRSVVAVATDGAVRQIGADRALLDRPVQLLRLSRDGTRVAAVVGTAGHGRLLVGRVTLARGGIRLDAFRPILPDAGDVRGLSWNGGDELVATAANAAGGREIVAVDVDGYGTRTLSTSGLSGEPVDLAVAPGGPLLVTAGHAVWRDNATGGWTRVAAGGQPVYPD
jgi:hypothetical protein